MSAAAHLRAVGGSGLWSVLLPCGALLPVAATVAFAHVDQWPVGSLAMNGMGAASADPWQSLVVPVAFHAWTAGAALLLAGFTTGLAPPEPRRLRRLQAALARAGLVFLAVALVSLPGVVWLWRLGAVLPAACASAAARAALGAALAAALGGTLGAVLPRAAALAASLGVTLCALVLAWSTR